MSLRLLRLLKLLAAALFVLAGMFGFVAIASIFWPGLTQWMIPVALTGFGVVIFAAYFFFGEPVDRRTRLEKLAEGARQLEQDGLLTDETYRALRAFQVEEFEDEGSHYFVELTDGGVLFLSGQYLWDYEPLSRMGVPRRFPCTEFTVRRHKVGLYAVDVICGGAALEPEVVAPPFEENDFKSDRLPQDGDVIRDRTYVQLKDERMAVRQR